MDTARRSPVCLDLMVGLPMVREPSPARGAGMGNGPDIASPACGRAASTTNNEAKVLEAKLTQMSEENRRLTEMIAYLNRNQVARQSLEGEAGEPPASTAASPTSRKRSRDSTDTSNSGDANSNKKIGTVEADHVDVESPVSDSTCRRIKVKRVCTPIDPSDTSLVVKDGYQWRKYGQKVQRSAENSSVLEATYEGEHNHPHPSRSSELPSCATPGGSVPCSISINSSGPTITLDLTKDGGGVQLVEAQPDLKKVCREVASPEFQRALVEQMARDLTADTNFTRRSPPPSSESCRITSYRVCTHFRNFHPCSVYIFRIQVLASLFS
ncbi:hypothetical protein ACQ4PT_023960 [Festuca glaucescens]